MQISAMLVSLQYHYIAFCLKCNHLKVSICLNFIKADSFFCAMRLSRTEHGKTQETQKQKQKQGIAYRNTLLFSLQNANVL